MMAAIPPVSHVINMLNLSRFRLILVSALWAGLWAGLLLTAIQSIQVIPILLQAEVYEQQAELSQIQKNSDKTQDNKAHQHETVAWQPENGWERTFYTATANIALAVGFALLIAAASNLRGGIKDWRCGLLWGLAGYSIFFVAPSLGMAPEVPGTEAADLQDRQLWWLLAVSDTAIGLWLLVFSKTSSNIFLGLLLLASPHLLGAPQPSVQSSVAPEELSQSFIIATSLANGVFWLALGSLMGLFSSKHEATHK